MTVLSRFLARTAKLGEPTTRKIVVERDLEVPLADGVTGRADRYAPANAHGVLPTVLIRTPYGRKSGAGYAHVFAERGYQVVVAAVRGTGGSSGQFTPFQTDRDDGVATIDWLTRQPWFGGAAGRVGMFGPSYLAFVQWAVAAERPDVVAALSLQVGTSQPREMIYAGGGFALRTTLAWTHLVNSQADGLNGLQIKRRARRVLPKGYASLPLSEADNEVIGRHFPFFQDLLANESPDDPLWKSMDFRDRVAEVAAPVAHVTGWFDIFLRGQLDDYRRQVAAGAQPRLTVGPWGHTSMGWLGPALKETMRLFDSALRGVGPAASDEPVHVYVMGAGEWTGLPSWPPPTQPMRLHLHPGGHLADFEPADSDPDRYHYDPRDPTPDVGGTADPEFGSRDNRQFETRPDVLVYTSDTLAADVEVMGGATAELYVASTLEHTDFVARLCDVAPNGRSTNVCDGMVRLGPETLAAEGPVRIAVELWPTAYRWKKGHRLRLQVASAAHPRFARNTGSGEPLASATTLVAATQSVFHDPARPSAVVLPVRSR